MFHTAAELLAMPRRDLLRVAANLGLRVVGIASASLVDAIMVRVGELLVRKELAPVDVRLFVLEEGLVRLEAALVEQGAALAYMYDALRLVAMERGISIDDRLRPLSAKYRLRNTLTMGGR